MRILVPLAVSDEQFDEGLGVLEAALIRRGEQARRSFSRLVLWPKRWLRDRFGGRTGVPPPWF